jgi:hypothetical protein
MYIDGKTFRVLNLVLTPNPNPLNICLAILETKQFLA